MSQKPTDTTDIDKLPPPAERAGGMRIPHHRGVANIQPASHGEKDRAREAAVKQLSTGNQGESEGSPSDQSDDSSKSKDIQKDKDEGKDKQKDKQKEKDEGDSSLSAASIIDTASNIGHKLMDAVMHPVQAAQDAVQAVSDTVIQPLKSAIAGEENDQQGADRGSDSSSSSSGSKSTEINKSEQQSTIALQPQDTIASLALPEERRKVAHGDLTATKGHFPSVYNPPNNLAAQKHPNHPSGRNEKVYLTQPRQGRDNY